MQAHPQPSGVDLDVLVRCITECLDCTTSCTSCADSCLAEPDVQELVRCIRLCLDCADICGTTARVVTRQTAAEHTALRPVVEACAASCRLCAEECERHASHHEHCRLCEATCRSCVDACDALLAALG